MQGPMWPGPPSGLWPVKAHGLQRGAPLSGDGPWQQERLCLRPSTRHASWWSSCFLLAVSRVFVVPPGGAAW